MVAGRRALTIAAAAGSISLVATACGGEAPAEEPVPARSATVYLSAPLDGASEDRARAVAAGARLALRDADGEAGGWRVRLEALDSSDPDAPAGTGSWDPGAVARNADLAVSDPTAVAYLGELELGGSAVSVPITNGDGLLQVSPGDGLTSLTRPLPNDPGTGPERYYPSGERNFLRLVPTDFLQASALLRWALAERSPRVAFLHDGGVFGRELAGQSAFIASCRGLEPTGPEQVGPDASGYDGLAERLKEERPRAVVYAGASRAGATALLEALDEGLPRARLFAAGGVAEDSPPRAGGLDARVGPEQRAAVRATRASGPPERYPAGGRRVLDRLERVLGAPPPSDALLGYEAMAVVLDAIERAGGDPAAGPPDPDEVRVLALAPRVRASVLGTYVIGSVGDVSRSAFSGYLLDEGGFEHAGLRLPGRRLAPPSPKLSAPEDECDRLLRLPDATQ